MSRPDDGPFHASVPLGRLAGVRVGLPWSWFAVQALFTWGLGDVLFPAEYPGLSDVAYAAMALFAALALFACLLAHELGHALQARREGVEIEGSRCGCSAALLACGACSHPPAPSCGSRSPARSSASC
jgi:hypothetical protein